MPNEGIPCQEDKTIFQSIKDITASAVLKKQDAAKLNFPTIIEKIKVAAALGESSCQIGTSFMNEYDKHLLVAEGFRVTLINKPIDSDLAIKWPIQWPIQRYEPNNDKVWEICW